MAEGLKCWYLNCKVRQFNTHIAQLTSPRQPSWWEWVPDSKRVAEGMTVSEKRWAPLSNKAGPEKSEVYNISLPNELKKGHGMTFTFTIYILQNSSVCHQQFNYNAAPKVCIPLTIIYGCSGNKEINVSFKSKAEQRRHLQAIYSKLHFLIYSFSNYIYATLTS